MGECKPLAGGVVARGRDGARGGRAGRGAGRGGRGGGAGHHGRVVHVDPMKPMLKAPGIKRL